MRSADSLLRAWQLVLLGDGRRLLVWLSREDGYMHLSAYLACVLLAMHCLRPMGGISMGGARGHAS